MSFTITLKEGLYAAVRTVTDGFEAFSLLNLSSRKAQNFSSSKFPATETTNESLVYSLSLYSLITLLLIPLRDVGVPVMLFARGVPLKTSSVAVSFARSSG